MNDFEVLELCKKLRSETGHGVSYCKQALILNKFDFDKTKDWIKKNPPSRILINEKL